MAKNDKLLVTIEERNGDMEYDARVLTVSKGSNDAAANRIAKDWRSGSTWDKDYQAYWNDGTLISVGNIQVVTEEDFAVLRKYFTVL